MVLNFLIHKIYLKLSKFSKSLMTIKLVYVGTYDNLLLSTQSCDRLIFWSYDNQIAELFKGTSPGNSNIFETN